MNRIEYLKGLLQLHGKKVEWGIIEERIARTDAYGLIVDEPIAYKPGLFIKGSRVYYDIYSQQFFSTIDNEGCTRKIFPARWRALKDGMAQIAAKAAAGPSVTVSSTLVEDIFSRKVYGRWMEEQVLL